MTRRVYWALIVIMVAIIIAGCSTEARDRTIPPDYYLSPSYVGMYEVNCPKFRRQWWAEPGLKSPWKKSLFTGKPTLKGIVEACKRDDLDTDLIVWALIHDAAMARQEGMRELLENLQKSR